MSEETQDTESPGKRATALRMMMFAAIGIIVVLASSSAIVNENEDAIIVRFGKPVRIIQKAGWYFHLPAPVESVKLIDTRLQHGSIRLSETLTRDKRNVIIPMYFAWRVEEPLKFLNNVETPEIATAKLDSLITSMRNSVIGRNDFSALVGQEGNRISEMENELLKLAAADAREHFGVQLIKVGITEIKLPKGNTESVFRRMRSERKREASTYRAEGKAASDRIKTEADTEARALLAEARKTAEEMRGKAEAQAASIYASAHGKDIDFYRFLRSLQSLRAVVDKNTTLVLDTNSSPFNLLRPEAAANPMRFASPKSAPANNLPLDPAEPAQPPSHVANP
ncbi:protease modulator HflC [Luteolibacter algae]|uniref:Protein HflC n=1 Tax=Luteolibacter algae TaxID=454151 RepID=A0ABW5D7Z1_9BACT